jgi:putative ABC transport system permease protein
VVRNLLRDGRYGLRALLKNRGTTSIAILALALGIGANTVIYSVVNRVLLHPIAFPQADQLVVISGLLPGSGERALAYPADFDTWSAQRDVFQEVAAIRQRDLTMTGKGEPAELRAEEVTPNYFGLLGIRPLAGRTFSSQEDNQGSEQVAVIGEGLWRREFSGNSDVIGSSLVLNSTPYTLIGVVPDENWGKGHQSQVWVPLVLNRNFQARYLQILGRMRPGVDTANVQRRLQMASDAEQLAYPELQKGRTIQVIGLDEEIVSGVRSALLTLWVAVGLVLLIACANVANILLVRIMAREREIALRRALGASRWGVVQQFLMEGIVLAIFGGIAGLALAKLGLELLIKFGPADIPSLAKVAIDGSLFAFAGLLSLLTGIIFGLVPALRASTMEVNGLLKDGSSSVTGNKTKIRLRDALVVSEVLLAMVLLVAAGLMINSVYRLQKRELGFDAHNLLTLRLNLPASQYSDTVSKVTFFRNLESQIGNQPGVVSLGMTAALPGDRQIPDTDVIAVGHPAPKSQTPKAAIQVIGDSYFETMHIPIRAGRTFSAVELQNSSPRVVINETLSRELFAGNNPIGKLLVLAGDEQHPDEIIGVVGDVTPRSANSSQTPVVFYTYPRLPFPSMALVVRTTSNSLTMAHSVVARIHQVDPNQPVAEISTMEDLLTESVSRPRFSALLLGMFAFSALLLASIGIYGIVSYTVGQSTREIGVRMALGASRATVLRTMLLKGLVPVGYGIGAGLLISMAITRFMASLLFEVQPYDPLTFIGVSLLFALIAALAAYVPARRATKVDPWNALRFE